VAGEGLRSWRRPQWSGDGEHRRCWREMALVGGVGRVAWVELRKWGQPQRLGDGEHRRRCRKIALGAWHGMMEYGEVEVSGW
jgi:hypothetical protein